MIQMKILKNDIVKLILMELAHVDGLFQAAQDERIWTHMSIELLTRENVELYVTDAVNKRESGTDFAFVIADAQSDQIIGATWYLDISRQHKHLEIGSTWLNPNYWRTNLNTNCKFLLLSYGFEELGMQRIQIKTGHENLRSQQAIERIGATKEGVLRNHMIRKEGTIRHTVMYSIIQEEWPEIKKHFETVLMK